jgi:steroid 5-alpha reductase family enzyme
MPLTLPPLAFTALLLAGGMSALWLLSLPLRNASIVDACWGPAFAVAGWGAALRAGVPLASPRTALALALVTLWSARLALHLLVRNAGTGEDPRYAAMRRGHGARFWWVSLLTVFLLQAALAWAISLPVQLAILAGGPLGWLDGLAALTWLAGFAFETIGDLQLTRFRADPRNRGRALDTGLWRYTRHPNYFGDALLWWGFGLLGVAAGAPWTLFAPALMTFLLLKVSGVALLEQGMAGRRPAYRAYVERTNAFLPWRPRPAAAPPEAERQAE